MLRDRRGKPSKNLEPAKTEFTVLRDRRGKPSNSSLLLTKTSRKIQKIAGKQFKLYARWRGVEAANVGDFELDWGKASISNRGYIQLAWHCQLKIQIYIIEMMAVQL